MEDKADGDGGSDCGGGVSRQEQEEPLREVVNREGNGQNPNISA